jgi:hypothetical protein
VEQRFPVSDITIIITPKQPTLDNLAKSSIVITIMDEKHQQTQPPAMSHRRARPLALVALLFVFALTFWRWPSSTPATWGTDSLSNLDDTPSASEKRLVPLEAHIISKCPDTRVHSPKYIPAQPPALC